jgi:hypothetical protein
MKNICQKILIMLIIAITFSENFVVYAQTSENDFVSQDNLISVAENIITYEKSEYGISDENSLFSGDFLKDAGESSADWLVIGASRLGLNEDYTEYLKSLENDFDANNFSKATDLHRLILTVCACGESPVDFVGENLFSLGIEDYENLGKQGLNGYIWGLIALDTVGYKTSDSAQNDRDKIITEILSAQHEDGSFSLYENFENSENFVSTENDLTAMAVIALAPYAADPNDSEIAEAVELSINLLSKNQLEDGSYGSCETTAQVVSALCSAGIDPSSDSRFTKDKNVLQALLDYQNDNGGFAHIYGENSDSTSAAQALTAIAAAVRFEGEFRRLYDFREEFSESERAQLAQLNQSNFSDSTQLESSAEIYNELSADLATYVSRSVALKLTDDNLNVLNSTENFRKTLSQNASADTAKGHIYDITNGKEYEYSDSTDSEISRINAIIAKKLYPFENLSEEQEELAEEIYENVLELTPEQQSQITGCESLLGWHKKVKYRKWRIYAVLALSLIAVCVIVFLAKRKLRKSTEE